MKQVITVLFALCVGIQIYAQTYKGDETVSLIVSADGETKEEATKIALRSAIEQAYGVFVSSNTTILNDQIVADEIATVSSGNIKSYQEISSTLCPNGRTLVTLNAIVCISNLVSYSESKGTIVEFSGSLFGINHSIRELNKRNEIIALENLVNQINGLMPYAFDKSISFSNIKENKQTCDFIATVSFTETEVLKNIKNIYWSTLLSIGLNDSELKEYKSLGIAVTPVYFDINDDDVIGSSKELKRNKGDKYVWLRNSVSDLIFYIAALHSCVIREQYNVDLLDNIGNHSISSPEIMYKYDKSQLKFLQNSYGDEKGLDVFLCTYPIGLVLENNFSGYIKKINSYGGKLLIKSNRSSYSWALDANISIMNEIQYTLSIPLVDIPNISKFEIVPSTMPQVP